MKPIKIAVFLIIGMAEIWAIQLSQKTSRGSWRRQRTNSSKSNKDGDDGDIHDLNLGLILPHSIYNERHYYKAVSETLSEMQRSKRLGFAFLKRFNFTLEQVHKIMMKVNPSPTEILDNLCNNFVEKNVSTILYLTNSELFGRSTASSQYFLQLASYLGIPVISWNADNSGLEKGDQSQGGLQLQLAPSLDHQVAAMLSILVRYNWHQFSVVTSEIAGHDDFVQTVRDRVAESRRLAEDSGGSGFNIQAEVKVRHKEDLSELVQSETRIILLYSTREEAASIMKWAKELALTGESFVWIVTQSVIGGSKEALAEFPTGMLGVSFETSLKDLIKQIPEAIKVFAHGVESFVADSGMDPKYLIPHLSCEGNDKAVGISTRWNMGETFLGFLRDVTIKGGAGRPDLAFLPDGTLQSAELKIMNLRPGVWSNLVWEEIGVWQSFKSENNGLDITDIVWPGNSHVPPQGVPEKFHLRVGFLEEAPFIIISPPDPVSGKCNVDRGVPCKTNGENGNGTMQCCSGFCIDLLAKFAADLQFEFDLVESQEKKWGVLRGGKWNGIMADIVEKKIDMVLTSLKVNAEREAAVDFTAPFLESGTTILVSKRTGIISPTAFLEPFDAASWLIIAIGAVQLSALTIFLFEWLSPAGYDMKSAPAPDHKFSLFRTYWLVWALLFQAPVNMDCPRAFTARFMASVWALFAVVFLAIYTASLAAFMITREEWDAYRGLDDPRLANPQSVKPPLKFGTIEHTYTDNALLNYFPQMHMHMKAYGVQSPMEGLMKVKKGHLDAFIYDGTVLEYLVAQDEDCKLLTVGSWYAMTGYGAAFPRNSKHFDSFNRKIMDYSENGDLERLRRFWLTGTCHPTKEEKKASEPLAPEQFLLAFLLLLGGVILSAVLMGCEHAYIKGVRKKMTKTDQAGCCALLSLSMGKSLTFRGTVYEASELMKTHRCKDPVCDTHLWKVKHELDVAKIKMKKLEDELLQMGIEPWTGEQSVDISIQERRRRTHKNILPSKLISVLNDGRKFLRGFKMKDEENERKQPSGKPDSTAFDEDQRRFRFASNENSPPEKAQQHRRRRNLSEFETTC